jgi:uncharacterized protein YcfJ
MFTKHLSQKLIIFIAVVVMVSACATTNDTTNTKAQGTAVGAGAGAIVGGVLGAVFGGKQGAAIGAGAGALVGGAGGYAAGTAVANKKVAYAAEEDRLNEQIRVTSQNNKDLWNYNQQMKRRIAALKKEISALRSRSSEDEAQATALREKQDEITELIGNSNTRLNEEKQKLARLNEYQQTVQNQANVAKLNQEVSTLRNNIAMLDNNNAQMAQLVGSLDVRR